VTVNNLAPFYMEKSELVTVIVTLVVAVIGGIAIFLFARRRPTRVNVIELAVKRAREEPDVQALFINNSNDYPQLTANEANQVFDNLIRENIQEYSENYNENYNGNLSRGIGNNYRKQRRRRSRKSKRT